MTYSYKTHGTCSRRIDFDLDDDNTVHNVHFTGGCNGNLAGISSIVEGMDAEEIIDRFDGIRCGFKQTSCPDQFAEALREAPLTTPVRRLDETTAANHPILTFKELRQC